MTDRGIGVASGLGAALPDPVLAALSVLTQLGDVWFVIAALTAVYWFHDRRAGAFAIAAAVGALALVVGLKHAFALPRPPPAVRGIPADGFGFPSGHAVAATVLWSLLALVVDVWDRRRRAVVAAVAIAVVGATRVGLGVHYVVDVVAGTAVGLVYVAGLLRLTRRRPGPAFGVAVALAVLAAVVAGGDTEALVVVGTAVGAALAWRTLEVPAAPWTRGDAGVAAVGAGLLGGFVGAGYWLGVQWPLVIVVGAIGGAGIVGLPALVGGGAAPQKVSR